MSSVVLVQPPQTALRSPLSYIPLGLAYMGAVLEESGVDVEVLNLAGVENITGIEYPDADWYGVTCTSATYDTVRNMMPDLTWRGKVAVGGPHPSVLHQEVADVLGVDMVVAGEAEYLLRDVVTGLRDVEPVIDAGMIKDLNQLPLPARHLFDFDDVVDKSGIHGQEVGESATTVLTSRGCPYQCAFCCKGHPMFSFYRYREADGVYRELESLINDYDISHIRFVDDEFTLNQRRTADLMRKITPLGLSWVCITRADSLNPSLLKLMKKAGCEEVHIGVETGSDRLLRLMNKRTTTEVLYDGIQMIKEAGIRAKTYLMVNYPGENEKDVELTKEFMRQAKPEKWTLSNFTPLPGSVIYDSVKQEETPPWFYPDKKGNVRYIELKEWLEGNEWK